ncbi:hypothetical protein ABID49_000815, partial [Bhargavaea ullalensis]
KASANKHKFTKKVVRKETRAYQSLLEEEINADRVENGKKPFPEDRGDREEEKEIQESTTDPEIGYYVKDGQRRMCGMPSVSTVYTESESCKGHHPACLGRLS